LFTLRERLSFMNEKQIVARAIERLGTHTGLKARWVPRTGDLDGELDFHFTPKNLHVFAEVKRELRQYQLPQIFEMAEKHHPFMVVAENIFPTIKELLRDKKIGYLDTAGNIFIHADDTFIWIDGNKPVEEKKPATNRAFTKTGLKTVFYLLLVEDAINMPYRKLAEATDVALGNIKNVMEGLKDAGFILRVNDTTLKLKNKKTLLERWITGYGETLRPALKIGTYKFLNKEKFQQWQDLPHEIGETIWGGEPAAEHLTNYLVPTDLTLYTNQKTKLVVEWKLIPDKNGNVHFYQKFWKNEKTDQEKYAPPLLVYADLLLTNDPRCQETAEMIYEKYLKNEFK
jgi:hypothetical protein